MPGGVPRPARNCTHCGVNEESDSTGMKNSTAHESYKVAAISVIGQGALSASDAAIGASTPTAPLSLVATTGTATGAVDLTWSAPASSGTHPVTAYRIERKIGAGSFTLVATMYFEDENCLYNPRLQRRYEIRDGIPVMLIDEATSVDANEHHRLMEKADTQGIHPNFEDTAN